MTSSPTPFHAPAQQSRCGEIVLPTLQAQIITAHVRWGEYYLCLLMLYETCSFRELLKCYDCFIDFASKSSFVTKMTCAADDLIRFLVSQLCCDERWVSGPQLHSIFSIK